ncbi:kelch repeat-containing protein [Sorangium sp. So ce1128]
MRAARSFHSTTQLQSGEVLVAGGSNYFLLDSAELYDPSAGVWSPTRPVVTARAEHTATPLPRGQVLVAGGGTNTAHGSTSSERLGVGLGEVCTAMSVCLFGDVCADGICCDAPCPCGACDAEGHCGREGSPAKVGSICEEATCADETGSLAPARCAIASSSCPERVRVDCVTYRCDEESGACKTSCAALDDCAPGYVCNLRGHCVLPPSEQGAAGGCSAAAGSSTSAAAARALGVVLLALGAACRRRRAAAVALVQ